MVHQKELNKQYPLPKWFWITLIAVLSTIVAAIGYFFLWQTGWPDYLHALRECGGKPPVETSSFLAKMYINPGDDKYRIPGQGGYRTYFCREDEVKSAGYKHLQ